MGSPAPAWWRLGVCVLPGWLQDVQRADIKGLPKIIAEKALNLLTACNIEQPELSLEHVSAAPRWRRRCWKGGGEAGGRGVQGRSAARRRAGEGSLRQRAAAAPGGRREAGEVLEGARRPPGRTCAAAGAGSTPAGQQRPRAPRAGGASTLCDPLHSGDGRCDARGDGNEVCADGVACLHARAYVQVDVAELAVFCVDTTTKSDWVQSQELSLVLLGRMVRALGDGPACRSCLLVARRRCHLHEYTHRLARNDMRSQQPSHRTCTTPVGQQRPLRRPVRA